VKCIKASPVPNARGIGILVRASILHRTLIP
jgi:hypothetical protein